MSRQEDLEKGKKVSDISREEQKSTSDYPTSAPFSALTSAGLSKLQSPAPML